MTTRYYVIPAKLTPMSTGIARSPKYLYSPLYNPAGLNIRWNAMDYGLQPVFLVRANVSTAQHTGLAAQSDVIAVPENINNQIGAGLYQVQAALETLHIPAGWVVSTNTYKEVLRAVARIFQFFQRMHGMFGEKLIDGAVNLNTTWSQIPQSARSNLRDAADSMGFDYSSVGPTTTVRQILKMFADQYIAPILLGGDEF